MKFPIEALGQHIAILGKTGSGKTYTAKGLVEHILGEGRRVCIVDPTGAWWGLRSSADGNSPGFPVVILGGSHGDAPLPPESGAACARLVCDHSLQVVFDTSRMSVGERTRWFAAFAGDLFRGNTKPLHVVLDEAHVFAPQGKVPDPDTGKMLHAANQLASGGRSRGIRLMMITQRPAKLHKDSLPCCDTPVAMRVIAPQDRNAVEEWIEGNGDLAKSKAVLNSLAQLARGEGWVWYSETGFLERMKFPPIKTYDSSKTPEDGDEPPEIKSAAEIDLTAIAATMAEAVEEAKANDPKALRARIKELEARVNGPNSDADIIDAGRVAQLESERREYTSQITDLEERLAFASRVSDGRLIAYQNLWKSVDAWRQELARRLGLIDIDTDQTIEDFKAPELWPFLAPNETNHALEREAPRREAMPVGDSAGRQTPTTGRAETRPVDERRAPAARAHTRQPPGESAPGAVAGNGVALTGPQRRVLNALAWWHGAGIHPTRVQTAHIAEYSPTGGSWRNVLSECRSLGLIRDLDGDRLELTSSGWLNAERVGEVPTVEDLHVRLKERLNGPQKKIFDVLLNRGRGEAMSRTQVAELAGYEATGGSFRNTCSELSSLGLVTYPNKTTIAVAAWVMGVKS